MFSSKLINRSATCTGSGSAATGSPCARSTGPGEKVFVDYAGQQPHLDRSPHRRRARGRALRRRPRREQLHLRGSHPHPAAPRLAREPRPHVPLLRRGHHGHRLRPVEERGHASRAATSRGSRRRSRSSPPHTGTTILPARPRTPRDKAKVEVAVQVAERWILARLRHERFFGLGPFNARIAELLADLNAAPHAPLRGEPAGALRAARSAGPPAPARDALRLRRVEAAPRSTSITMSKSTTTTTLCPTPWSRSGSRWTSG